MVIATNLSSLFDLLHCSTPQTRAECCLELTAVSGYRMFLGPFISGGSGGGLTLMQAAFTSSRGQGATMQGSCGIGDAPIAATRGLLGSLCDFPSTACPCPRSPGASALGSLKCSHQPLKLGHRHTTR